MTPTETLRPEAVAELAAKATPNPRLVRYDHGGGRLLLEANGLRDLVADFYDEGNREFYTSARHNWPLHAARLVELQGAANDLLTSFENYTSENKPESEWDEYDHMMLPKWKRLREALAPKVTP